MNRRRRLIAPLAVALCVALAASATEGWRDIMPQDNAPTYTIKKTAERPDLTGDWAGPVWSKADTLTLEHFYDAGSDHRPLTQAKVLYDKAGVYVLFRVEDKYVRSIRTGYQAMVCKDSCVELFVQPQPDKGYLNFEVNCGGTMLLTYIEDPTPAPGGFAKMTRVPWKVASGIRVGHSMPEIVPNEVEEPTTWTIEYFVPYSVFETYVGKLGDMGGQEWRANFYKCADDTSHPHWGMWSPIKERLSFHQPKYFAPIHFEK